uniref:Uncharacterized protein n=1 Tax=Oryza meridionalis TaxID=40149 RepID=A0A0E0C4I5_9ORYZ
MNPHKALEDRLADWFWLCDHFKQKSFRFTGFGWNLKEIMHLKIFCFCYIPFLKLHCYHLVVPFNILPDSTTIGKMDLTTWRHYDIKYHSPRFIFHGCYKCAVTKEAMVLVSCA